MADDIAPSDLVTLNNQLRSQRFLAGVDAGRWLLVSQDKTLLVVTAIGRDHASGQAAAFDFRLECSGIPEATPYVERWDRVIGERPAAPKAGESSPGVCDALKDWEPTQGTHGGVYRAWQ